MSVRPQTKEKPSPVNFQWDDPFLLDEQLTEDERMIRDTARAYAQDKLLPRVTKAYLEEKVDRDIFHDPSPGMSRISSRTCGIALRST